MRVFLLKLIGQIFVLALFLALCADAFFCMFWFAAQPREKALARYGNQIEIPEEIPAVVVFSPDMAGEKPKVMFWEPGSIGQNPLGFTLAVLSLFVLFGLIVLIAALMNRLDGKPETADHPPRRARRKRRRWPFRSGRLPPSV